MHVELVGMVEVSWYTVVVFVFLFHKPNYGSEIKCARAYRACSPFQSLIQGFANVDFRGTRVSWALD